ncbi:MAG: M20/M25/M40 family metallo-hydrolase [Desulfobacteraceae bacterium]|jgi:succinyl-diaminopimelate desuccinylase
MEEIIRLTKDLIRFRSMRSQPEQIIACANFIEKYLRDAGVNCRRLDRDYVPSILALPQDNFASVLLMSHIDVVDGADKLFEPSEEEGKLYGRGSLDDKYAVALSLVLLKAHLEALRQRNKGQEELPFGVLITGDEEIGGHRGAREALREIKTEFCIALDGGGIEKIVSKEKGVLRLKLISRGKSAHGARPWLGENAIEKLVNDYLKIKPFFEESTPEHWHRTMNFSIIHAGKSANQVPDYAEAVFDIRYTENDDVDELIEKIRRDITSEVLVEAKEPLFHGGDSPYLNLLLDVSKETKVGFEHGASDARFLKEHGTKGIVWGADGDQSAHSEEEHVNIESVYELYRILDEFMRRVKAEIQ